LGVVRRGETASEPSHERSENGEKSLRRVPASDRLSLRKRPRAGKPSVAKRPACQTVPMLSPSFKDLPMRTILSVSLVFGSLIVVSTLWVGTVSAPAANPQVPQGFTALFNGKDLAGWHGWNLHQAKSGPYDLEKMTPEERAKKIAEWTADAQKHWKVENGELVNDGHGAYLTTDKDYGDIELLIEYKTVPKADSGIYRRATPQVQIWDYTDKEKFRIGADKGSGGLWNNSPGAPGKDPLVLADKPFGEW